MTALEVCLRLFVARLSERGDGACRIESSEEPAPNALAAAVSDGERSIAIDVRELLEPVESPVWLSYRDQLEGEIASGLQGAFALWVPPGADLPEGDAATEFVERVREAAAALSPGERSDLALPAKLYLRRTQEEGALMSVSGGLNRHWARLSEKAHGAYDLDSTSVHRLPESDEHLESLFEAIWERAAALTRPGETAEIETIDAWTLQRLDGGDGVTIVGRPPEEIVDLGLAVRRSFRRILADAAPRLRSHDAESSALIVLGAYGRMEDEGATVAMRGYDPALYAGLDYVVLAADGLIKPLIEPRSEGPG